MATELDIFGYTPSSSLVLMMISLSIMMTIEVKRTETNGGTEGNNDNNSDDIEGINMVRSYHNGHHPIYILAPAT